MAKDDIVEEKNIATKYRGFFGKRRAVRENAFPISDKYFEGYKIQLVGHYVLKNLGWEGSFSEYVGGNVMRFLMQDPEKAPKLRLNINSKKEVQVCSKLLTNYNELRHIKLSPSSEITAEIAQSIINSWIIGDHDYHGFNLGLIIKGQSSKIKAARIDFDCALGNWSSYDLIKAPLYKRHPEIYNKIFDAPEFIDELKKIVKINKTHLKYIIKTSIDNLEYAYKKSNDADKINFNKVFSSTMGITEVITSSQCAGLLFEKMNNKINDLVILANVLQTARDLASNKILPNKAYESFSLAMASCSDRGEFETFISLAQRHVMKITESDNKKCCLELNRFKAIISQIDFEDRIAGGQGLSLSDLLLIPSEDGPTSGVFHGFAREECIKLANSIRAIMTDSTLTKEVKTRCSELKEDFIKQLGNEHAVANIDKTAKMMNVALNAIKNDPTIFTTSMHAGKLFTDKAAHTSPKSIVR